MSTRQVAFASARYIDDEGFPRVGHRGDILEIPAKEIERLDKLGALVPEGGELHKPGVLLPLLESADDEKVSNYLLSGNTLEILTQASEYPTTLVEKLVIAEQRGLNRGPLLTGLQKRVGDLTLGEPSVAQVEASEAFPSPLASVTPSAPAVAQTGDPGVTPTPATGDSTPEDELAQFVSSSTVEDVLARAGDDKELAQELLDAEETGKNRKTLVEKLNDLIEA